MHVYKLCCHGQSIELVVTDYIITVLCNPHVGVLGELRQWHTTPKFIWQDVEYTFLEAVPQKVAQVRSTKSRSVGMLQTLP
jgi:hypothetical protein